eukprot:CAMPEP_0177777178 /NCGR_PEP_ID=MMETSP0491_2-20121128/15175_1 /TAXON_ID=63592 /ORGANISM="Tetraselmis chuii, Strain PLY429" /LENGTH=331 /DNA_ID=CAMNT_0019296153 /DNA_START=208 /DNA_END=1203 /DNA_ORIENTATION=+
MNTLNVARAFCLVLLGFAQYGTCQTQSIAALASGRADLSTLVAALTQAELVETFSADGNYTVFAPTNDAFEAFLNASSLTAGDLLGNSTLLKSYLTYHVLPSVVASGDINNGAVVETLGGLSVGFDTTDGVKIAHGANTKVKVTEADIMASNGIIHVVDSVLVPPTMTITEMVADTASLSTLLAAVQAASLGDALAGAGPLTVFAPTNDGANFTLTALGLTPAELLASDDLAKYLQYHVTTGVVLSSTLTANTDIATLGDMTLPFFLDGDKDDLSILTPENIETADIMATNGVVHTVNKMMIPADSSAATTGMMTWAVVSLLLLAVGPLGL